MKRSGVVFCMFLLSTSPVRAAEATDQHTVMMLHGAQVMPFDRKATMHLFLPTADGGVVEVMVHGMDPKQIALVRSHLRAEALKFARGEYADPAYIHGVSMPGLAQLSAGAKLVRVRYSQTPTGAAITLESWDPVLIAAIHDWLSAQQRDHNPATP